MTVPIFYTLFISIKSSIRVSFQKTGSKSTHVLIRCDANWNVVLGYVTRVGGISIRKIKQSISRRVITEDSERKCCGLIALLFESYDFTARKEIPSLNQDGLLNVYSIPSRKVILLAFDD